MAKPVAPEPKFFLVDDLFERGLDYYSTRWFDDLPGDRLLGEKSTNYFESPVAAARIAAALPNVKLVFLLRDPVERAYSNYLWSKRNGLETQSFEQALQLEPSRERTLKPEMRYARPFSYFSRGLYADLLKPWFKLFDRNRILVLRSENIATAPSQVASRLHDFLEVEPHPEAITGLGIVNSALDENSEPMPDHVRRELAARYSQPNRTLAELLRLVIDAAVRELAAYGPIASRWAQLLSPDQPLIAVDAQGAAEGLIEAFRRARRGRRFHVRCLVEERRAALARVLTPTLLQQAASYDERRIVFSNLASESLQVNNAPLSSVRHLPANIVQTMQDIVRLSDGLVVSSQSEYHNLRALWPGYEPQTGYMQVSDSTVPAPPAGYSSARGDDRGAGRRI